METVVKLIVSFVIFFIGFMCAGLFPGFFGAILFVAALIGIGAVWRKRKVEGEGEVFKNERTLNKD